MNRFYVDFPLWYLRNAKFGNLAGEPWEVGKPAVFLFSDKKLAESYVAKRAEEADAAVVESVDRDHFRDFLDTAERGGFTHVIINPGPQPIFYESIPEMRARFEGQG